MEQHSRPESHSDDHGIGHDHHESFGPELYDYDNVSTDADYYGGDQPTWTESLHHSDAARDDLRNHDSRIECAGHHLFNRPNNNLRYVNDHTTARDIVHLSQRFQHYGDTASQHDRHHQSGSDYLRLYPDRDYKCGADRDDIFEPNNRPNLVVRHECYANTDRDLGPDRNTDGRHYCSLQHDCVHESGASINVSQLACLSEFWKF